MTASVLVAGLDAAALPDTPLLRRGGHVVEQVSGARALLARMLHCEPRLLLLGAGLDGLGDTLRRIRSTPGLRRVSILAIVPADMGPTSHLLKAGANAVLQEPLDPQRYEAWVARLLAVPRRLEVRVAVEGEVLASRRDEGRHFSGLTRNVSVNGMLLASPQRLAVGAGSDLDLEMGLGGLRPRFRALGRVVREAGEVSWPYLGYGVEFLFVPPECHEALAEFLSHSGAPPSEAPGIHSTVQQGRFIYEVLAPVAARDGWQCEVRRAARHEWRPGEAGPHYVVTGGSPEQALRAARDFVRRQA